MRGLFYFVLLLSFIFAIDASKSKSKHGYRMASVQNKKVALKMNDEDVAEEVPEDAAEKVAEDTAEEVAEDATEALKEIPEDATDDEGDDRTPDPVTPGGSTPEESLIHEVGAELRVLKSAIKQTNLEVASLKSQLTTALRQRQDLSQAGDGKTKTFAVNGKTYVYVNERKTWDEARQSCKGLGGDLASLPSIELNDAVVANLKSIEKKPRYMWVGAYHYAGMNWKERWYWLSGDALCVTFFPGSKFSRWAYYPNWTETKKQGVVMFTKTINTSNPTTHTHYYAAVGKLIGCDEKCANESSFLCQI